jgi:hypothetical protein
VPNHRSLPRALFTTTLGSFLFACAAAPAPPPPAPKNDGDLAAALEQRNTLLSSLESSPADQRRRCEIEVGDCRLDVNDARDKILRDHPSGSCRSASDSNREIECVMKELSQTGQTGVAGSYYRKESWCLQRLVACADQLAMAAVEASNQSRTDQRKASVEGSRRASDARALTTFAAEKVNYLRGLLPPDSEETCSDDGKVEACEKNTEKQYDDYKHALLADDTSYKEQTAIQLYENIFKARSECREPAFACLSKRLDTLGGTAETHQLMAQSLSALKRRQALIDQVGDEGAEACLSAGVQKHQGRIVEDYQRFVHEPVLFFQAQLHRDFRRLYETQTTCLQARARGGSRPLASR